MENGPCWRIAPADGFRSSLQAIARSALGHGALKREWITARDSSAPAVLDTIVGITTIDSSGGEYSRGEYHYIANIPVRTKDPLRAIEVRFVLFDICGDFIKTLSMTEVEDIPAGTVRTFSEKWNLFSENEASEYYASIAYMPAFGHQAERPMRRTLTQY